MAQLKSVLGVRSSEKSESSSAAASAGSGQAAGTARGRISTCTTFAAARFVSSTTSLALFLQATAKRARPYPSRRRPTVAAVRAEVQRLRRRHRRRAARAECRRLALRRARSMVCSELLSSAWTRARRGVRVENRAGYLECCCAPTPRPPRRCAFLPDERHPGACICSRPYR
jgi:hypothetical protein